MKKLFLFCSVIFVFMSTAKADGTFNECTKVGDSSSGVYFEDGYYYPSVNSSRHFFTSMILVVNGIRETYQFVGDQTYRAPCKAQDGGIAQPSLSQEYYQKFEQVLNCDNGSVVEIKLDLQSGSKINGSVTRQLKNGSKIAFDLECGK